jgi:hypothetical protein
MGKILFSFIFITLISACQNTGTSENQIIREAETAVANQLKDPYSAKFRGSFIVGGYPIHSAPPTVCGEVNAKNSFGAYIGYKRFYTDGMKTVIESDESDFQLYAIMCRI